MSYITQMLRELQKVLREDDTKERVDTPRKFDFADWKNALMATIRAIGTKRIGILAAGVAYFGTLAFFPLVAAAVAIASFIISGNQLHSVVSSIDTYLPKDIASLITTQLTNALHHKSSNIVVAVFSILLSLFSVAGAVTNLVSASNVNYDVRETRGFVKLRLISIFIMLSGLVTGVLVVGLLLLTQPVLAPLGVPGPLITVISIVRWIFIAGIVAVALAIFYRYGPNRDSPKWQWVSWGSTIASLLWLMGTALFFIYARYFAHFSQSYSLFAGIIVLMTWLNLTSFIVLLGAEINRQLEKRTVSKTRAK